MSFLRQGHRRIDRCSLELHRVIAAKLQAHPALMEVAHNNLARWERIGWAFAAMLGRLARV